MDGKSFSDGDKVRLLDEPPNIEDKYKESQIRLFGFFRDFLIEHGYSEDLTIETQVVYVAEVYSVLWPDCIGCAMIPAAWLEHQEQEATD